MSAEQNLMLVRTLADWFACSVTPYAFSSTFESPLVRNSTYTFCTIFAVRLMNNT